MLIQRIVVRLLAATFLVLGTGMVCGQDFPNKPIRIITAEPGGSSDFVARLIALGLSDSLGQQAIVDNRPGRVLPGQLLSKATPDGYTVMVNGASFWIGPHFQAVPYDPIKDFSPITLLTSAPNILVVHPSVPVKTVKELIDLAKAKPGELNYASAGLGASQHLTAELFKSMTGVNIVHIPFKGAGSAIIALVGGQVQMMFGSAASVLPYIKSGKLRAVAVTSAKPSALVPGLPTVAATLPGYDTGGATAMFAPARTPVAIITRLNREVVRLLGQADVKEKLLNVGVEAVGSSPEQLASTVKSETVVWGKVIKDAGIRAD